MSQVRSRAILVRISLYERRLFEEATSLMEIADRQSLWLNVTDRANLLNLQLHFISFNRCLASSEHLALVDALTSHLNTPVA